MRCDVCKRKFSHPSNLARHKSTHTGHKLHECDICNEIFARPRNLKTHKITVHRREKNFECALCKKTFTQKQNLKCHRQTHLRNVLLKGLLLCNTCGREIIPEQRSSKEVSNGNHHDCDKCNKQFLNLHRLNQHQTKEHGTSYKCEVCQELEASEATGIGYICFICDGEFEIATELENHIRTHKMYCHIKQDKGNYRSS